MTAELLPGNRDRLEECSAAELVNRAETAKRNGFLLLADIFGIDWSEYPRHNGKRFSVTYAFNRPDGSERLHLRVHLDDGDRLPTITHLFRAANFMEREVYDMFGIAFQGHPDLRKLLTPEDLIGHPHRKDFPLGETPTLFGDGRFLDPASFRAGLAGLNPGLTGWKGGARRGVQPGRRAKEPVDEAER